MNLWQTAVVTLGVITGTVYDAQHRPLGNAKVTLRGQDHQELVAVADTHGVYRFSVSSGRYTLQFGEAQVQILAEPGKPIVADLTAQPAFFDEPQYKEAGVNEFTYRGGHGSDAVFHSNETLLKDLKAEQTGSIDEREAKLYQQATELMDQHKAQAASEIFRKGVDAFPGSSRLLLGMAASCYAQGDYEEAATYFFRAADVSPNDPKPYLFMGAVKAKQITGSDGYMERMARFARLQPENAMAHYYYAMTLADDAAIPALERAVKLDPRLALAYTQLGAIAARKSDYTNAIRQYLVAISADPDLEEAHYRLSEAYRLTGNTAKAKEELTTFQRLNKAHQ